ncbi:VanZ family protein [Microbacterium mitrae]|nr:VanZ family protein [Microbacterium mitrae]
MWPKPVTEGPSKTIIEKVLAASHDAGVPSGFGFQSLQFLANIGMFIPFGFFLALALTRGRVWGAASATLAFSGAIELTQELFLPDRASDPWDVVANTCGGLIGLGLAVVLCHMVKVRDRWVVARALYFDARGA